MMKSNRKLVLRRESLRALAHRDLVRAAGGADAATIQLRDSEPDACRTGTPALDSGDAACITVAAKLGH
jgi:hypothetical protein